MPQILEWIEQKAFYLQQQIAVQNLSSTTNSIAQVRLNNKLRGSSGIIKSRRPSSANPFKPSQTMMTTQENNY